MYLVTFHHWFMPTYYHLSKACVLLLLFLVWLCIWFGHEKFCSGLIFILLPNGWNTAVIHFSLFSIPSYLFVNERDLFTSLSLMVALFQFTLPWGLPCHMGINHLYKNTIHHSCMAECAVNQTQCRYTPLKFCFLFSHTTSQRRWKAWWEW